MSTMLEILQYIQSHLIEMNRRYDEASGLIPEPVKEPVVKPSEPVVNPVKDPDAKRVKTTDTRVRQPYEPIRRADPKHLSGSLPVDEPALIKRVGDARNAAKESVTRAEARAGEARKLMKKLRRGYGDVGEVWEEVHENLERAVKACGDEVGVAVKASDEAGRALKALGQRAVQTVIDNREEAAGYAAEVEQIFKKINLEFRTFMVKEFQDVAAKWEKSRPQPEGILERLFKSKPPPIQDEFYKEVEGRIKKRVKEAQNAADKADKLITRDGKPSSERVKECQAQLGIAMQARQAANELRESLGEAATLVMLEDCGMIDAHVRHIEEICRVIEPANASSIPR
jgi:hypothetical protein